MKRSSIPLLACLFLLQATALKAVPGRIEILSQTYDVHGRAYVYEYDALDGEPVWPLVPRLIMDHTYADESNGWRRASGEASAMMQYAYSSSGIETSDSQTTVSMLAYTTPGFGWPLFEDSAEAYGHADLYFRPTSSTLNMQVNFVGQTWNAYTNGTVSLTDITIGSVLLAEDYGEVYDASSWPEVMSIDYAWTVDPTHEYRLEMNVANGPTGTGAGDGDVSLIVSLPPAVPCPPAIGIGLLGVSLLAYGRRRLHLA